MPGRRDARLDAHKPILRALTRGREVGGRAAGPVARFAGEVGAVRCGHHANTPPIDLFHDFGLLLRPTTHSPAAVPRLLDLGDLADIRSKKYQTLCTPTRHTRSAPDGVV